MKAMRIFHIFILFALINITALPAAWAKDTLLDIQQVTSPGGITAWLVEDHSVPVIALDFSFKNAGAAYDPEGKSGLARLASNTMDEGAGDLKSQDFQKELRDLVTSLYFNSSRDTFGGTLKTLSKNKARSFELLKLALTEPRFDSEPLERMRAANQSRIRRSMSDPEWIAARLMNDTAFEGHPYALNSGGTLSSLEAITPQDLREFHATKLGRNNLIVSAAGDITAEELGAALDDIFGSLPEVNTPALPDLDLQNTGSVILYEKEIPQTIVSITQRGIARNHPDYHAAQVMNYILGGSGFGSRLMEEIREKRGMTYGIYSSLSHYDHTATLSVSTSTKNDLAAEMLSLIKAEWEKMKTQPVSPEELAAAQSYLTGSVPLALTSTDRISGLLLSLQEDGLPIDYLDQREAAIKALTPEDIQKIANDMLNENNFVTVLVGQPQGINEPQKVTELPNVE